MSSTTDMLANLFLILQTVFLDLLKQLVLILIIHLQSPCHFLKSWVSFLCVFEMIIVPVPLKFRKIVY